MAWQYRTLFIDPDDLDALQWYGQEGWELVAAGRVGNMSDTWVLWLKQFVDEAVIDMTPPGVEPVKEVVEVSKPRGRRKKI